MEALLLSEGMTKKELFDALYETDPEGGPDAGVNIISVKLASKTMNEKIRNLNMELRTHRHNSYAVHRLVANA